MKTSKLNTWHFLATTAMVMAMPSAVVAQAAGEDMDALVLEEITVTALKRGEQVLQDVPNSIAVLSSKDLEGFGIQDFSGLSANVAGLDVQDLGPGDKRYIIRGINSAGEAQTAVYYDNIPMTGIGGVASDFGGRQPDLALFDIEQVAVLRGPQGTLYGSNSQAGVVHIVTKKPNLNEFELHGSVDLSTTKDGGENYSVKAAVNVPLINDKLAIRAVGYYTDNDGFIDNIKLGKDNVNDFKNKGVRLSVKAALSEDTTLLGQFFYQDMHSGGQPQYRPVDVTLATNVFPAAGFRKSDTGTLEPYDDEMKIYALTLEHDFGWSDLTIAGSYFDRDVVHREDISTSFRFFEFLQSIGEFPIFDVPAAGQSYSPQSSKMFTGEARLNTKFDGPVNGLFGVYYSDRDNDFETYAMIADAATGTPDPAIDPVSARNFQNKTKDVAVFTEVTADLSEKLELTGGIRWFQTKRSLDAETIVPFFGLGAPGVEPTQNSKNDDVILKFLASYQLTDDHILYAQYAQGYRSGGTNASTVAVVPPQYEPDRTENYEIGSKNTLLDNALTLNVAAYRITLKDLQANMLFGPGGAFSGTGNVSGSVARSTGVELDLNAHLSSNFTVGVSTNYNNVKLLKDVPELGAAAIKGAPLQNVPKFTYSMHAEYSQQLTDKLDGFIRANWQHVGNVKLTRYDEYNQALDKYDIVNLRLGVESDQYGVTLYADNLFDKAAQVNVLYNINEPLNFLTNRPRTIGLVFDVRF